MITMVILDSICHHRVTHFFLVIRTLKIYQQLSVALYSTVFLTMVTTLYFIPRTYLSYN